mmetsp:Transcript_58876/g.120468  ORF Transcript_58876/g.120468 Transcript_58876/m.120468 type:complete len:379 (-) Transcript_58876:77-1213(-)
MFMFTWRFSSSSIFLSSSGVIGSAPFQSPPTGESTFTLMFMLTAPSFFLGVASSSSAASDTFASFSPSAFASSSASILIFWASSALCCAERSASSASSTFFCSSASLAASAAVCCLASMVLCAIMASVAATFARSACVLRVIAWVSAMRFACRSASFSFSTSSIAFSCADFCASIDSFCAVWAPVALSCSSLIAFEMSCRRLASSMTRSLASLTFCFATSTSSTSSSSAARSGVSSSSSASCCTRPLGICRCSSAVDPIGTLRPEAWPTERPLRSMSTLRFTSPFFDVCIDTSLFRVWSCCVRACLRLSSAEEKKSAAAGALLRSTGCARCCTATNTTAASANTTSAPIAASPLERNFLVGEEASLRGIVPYASAAAE